MIPRLRRTTLEDGVAGVDVAVQQIAGIVKESIKAGISLGRLRLALAVPIIGPVLRLAMAAPITIAVEVPISRLALLTLAQTVGIAGR